jgi:hypothetical protein
MVRILLAGLAFAGTMLALGSDETALLQDPGGWEYQTITDANNGFQTQAVCFVEAFTGECRGTLLFRTDNTFRQDISAHGRSMHRGGRYEISGDQVTFWDEHNTQDGPYTITINRQEKTMHLETTQAGVVTKMDLLLESEFRKKLRGKKK